MRALHAAAEANAAPSTRETRVHHTTARTMRRPRRALVIWVVADGGAPADASEPSNT